MGGPRPKACAGVFPPLGAISSFQWRLSLTLSLTSPHSSEGVVLDLPLHSQVVSLPLNSDASPPCPDSVLSPQLIGATGISYSAGLKHRFGVDVVGPIPAG